MQKIVDSLVPFFNNMLDPNFRLSKEKSIDFEDIFKDIPYQYSIRAYIYIYTTNWVMFGNGNNIHEGIVNARLAKKIKSYEDEDIAIFTA